MSLFDTFSSNSVNGLSNNLILIFSARSQFESGRRRLYDLLERVEGCSHVTDAPSRYLIYDKDLVELDVAENTALHRYVFWHNIIKCLFLKF